MTRAVQIELASLDSTRRLARMIAEILQSPATVALAGTLGTGKTQFVRYFAECLSVPTEEVTSPTYVLLQRYRGKALIHHFDWYRLSSAEEVWDLGVDELYEQNTFVLIEWADKFTECLPEAYLRIEFVQTDDRRMAKVSAEGHELESIVEDLSQRIASSC